MVSSREPVPIQIPTETLRTWGMRSVTTRMPLGRTWRSMSRTLREPRVWEEERIYMYDTPAGVFDSEKVGGRG